MLDDLCLVGRQGAFEERNKETKGFLSSEFQEDCHWVIQRLVLIGLIVHDYIKKGLW